MSGYPVSSQKNYVDISWNISLFNPVIHFLAEEIRQSIRAIYDLKQFLQVVVEAESLNGGIRLSFCPTPFNTVSGIQISGNFSISSANVQDALDVKVGTHITPADIDIIRQDVLDFYRNSGFHQVQVNIGTQEQPGSQKVILTIEVQEGSPSQITSLKFTGATVFNERELLRASKYRIGMRYTLENLEEITTRVGQKYFEKGYFDIKFGNRDIKYQYDTGKADIVLEIIEGPQTSIRFEGNSQISTKKLLDQIDMSSLRNLDENSFAEYIEKLVEYYRTRGFAFAQVDYQYSTQDGQPEILFLIEEGPEIRVNEITFEGNQAFTSKELREVMFTATRGLLAKGLYQEKILEEDVTAIQAFYQQNGYLNAKVVSLPPKFSDDRRQVSLHLAITEGIQTRIQEIHILGEEDEDILNTINKLLLFRENEPLNVNQVSKSVDLILNHYANQGHIKAKVDVSPQFTDDTSGVVLTLDIDRGQQFFVGKISIQGVVRTKEKFILRELRLKEGDVYSREKITDSVKRLLQLGLYDSVSFRRLDTKSTSPVQDMLLEVKETPARDIEFGAGYSSEVGFKGFVEFTSRNVLSFGGRASIRGELSTERPKLMLQYVQPYFFSRYTSMIATVFDSILRDNPSYDLESRGVRLGVTYDFLKAFSMSATYFFEIDDPSNVAEDVVLSSLDTEILNIAGFVVRTSWDSRNNLLLPTKGGDLQLSMRTAVEALGSQTEFVELSGRFSWYIPVWKRLIFATSFNTKYIDPLGPSESIPIYYRYFLGGDISQNNPVRGFAKDEIGPTSPEGGKIGGERMYALNTELRFPIYGSIGGVVFYDTGANWLPLTGYEPEFRREGVGAGIRLGTPIGPLRFDYGWKIDRRSGETPGEYYLTIGSAF